MCQNRKGVNSAYIFRTTELCLCCKCMRAATVVPCLFFMGIPVFVCREHRESIFLPLPAKSPPPFPFPDLARIECDSLKEFHRLPSRHPSPHPSPQCPPVEDLLNSGPLLSLLAPEYQCCMQCKAAHVADIDRDSVYSELERLWGVHSFQACAGIVTREVGVRSPFNF